MRSIVKLLEAVLTVIIVLWELAEALAIPALLVLIGLLNSFPWQYYAATIGGYFIIAIVIQIICHFIFKHFEKKYESALMRLFEKIFKLCYNKKWPKGKNTHKRVVSRLVYKWRAYVDHLRGQKQNKI